MKQTVLYSILIMVILVLVAFVVGVLSVRSQRTCVQERSMYIDYAALSDKLKRESVAVR